MEIQRSSVRGRLVEGGCIGYSTLWHVVQRPAGTKVGKMVCTQFVPLLKIFLPVTQIYFNVSYY